MNEIIHTMAHIERKRRECNVLTHSPNEKLADARDRHLALSRLGRLAREARLMFESRLDRKRVRKRAAAVRHRANGIFNQFHRAVCKRAADELRRQRVEWFQTDNYRGFAQPRGRALGYYDWTRDPPGPVLFYPYTIIKVFID